MRNKVLPYALVGMLCGGAPASAADSPQALMESGHWKRARVLVEQSYRANPQDAETLWMMSRLKQAWHDLPAALDFGEKALAANPKESRYHLQVAEVVGDLAEKSGLLKQISLGRRFKKEIDASLTLDSRNTQALNNLMAYYYMAPSVIGGDKAKGRSIGEQIMRIDPVAGYNAQIQAANFEKQKDVPYEEIFLKMIAARPTAYSPHVQLANTLFGQKKYAEALEQGREAVRIDPGRSAGHTVVAAALALQAK
jgi:tetratricopeptide (TPR) repeat protein